MANPQHKLDAASKEEFDQRANELLAQISDEGEMLVFAYLEVPEGKDKEWV